MGLTTAMYSALSGMNANQTRIDTIGNNIANVNTTAFKGSRTLFATQFSQSFSLGTQPSETSGGTNPMQVGLGTLVASTTRNSGNGSIETTGINSDLAIDGNGMFILRRPAGQQVFTRDGSFTLNSANQLVTQNGDFVQGFGVDGSFNVVPNVLADLTIPVGAVSIARATSNVTIDGDLSAAGAIATQSSESATQPLVAGGGAAATATTALTDLRSGAAAATPLFAAASSITVRGVSKGQRELPPQTFVVGTDGSTLGDFASWLQTRLGIQTGTGLPGTPGVTVENGRLVIRGNAGETNAIELDAGDITSDNPAVGVPFQFTQNAAGNGSGAYTAFTVYDSLGTPVQVNVTFALESTPTTGPVWRFYAESPDNGATRALGTGTLAFDNQGNLLSVAGNQVSVDRSASGATSPLAFTLDFAGVNGLSTATSNVIAGEQDGFPPGTLTGWSVGNDGTITGSFSNGLARTLGQVAMARFSNPAGLVAESKNIFTTGANSGNPQIVAPGSFGSGQIISGALELSNVDLSAEFIGLITSSTGFQASSRVISTANELLNQLLLILR
ncbi:Flagellar hook protein FlgE [Phycisphaerae bacterium RAS1]|nr:Flagellar hook protein FlgE [Phycisphaerae bacterium RAS1]